MLSGKAIDAIVDIGKVDFETVNLILLSFRRPLSERNRMNVFILLVGVVVVGGVESVEKSRKP